MKILVINGPNLSRLDIRDSSIYGDLNYSELKSMIEIAATKHNFEADVRQSDDEATIIGWLHAAADAHTPVIINPAAFTHYSYALGDACSLLKEQGQMIIEVHISNPHAREEFRHKSVISAHATGVIAGFGLDSYKLALQQLSSAIN